MAKHKEEATKKRGRPAKTETVPEKKSKKSSKVEKASKEKKSSKSSKSAKAEKVKKTSKKTKVENGISPVKQKFNKSQLLEHIAEAAGVEKKVVKKVLESLEATIFGSVHPKGMKEFMMPGLFKIVAQHVPAKKARKGINPFTGEETTFKAKPATVRVKIRPMIKLKKAALS